MTKDELQKKIDIILSQIGIGAVIYDSQQTSGLDLLDLEKYIAGPGEIAVINEPLLLLRTLFGQCDPELKAEFIPLLLGSLRPINIRVIGHAVLDVGTLDDLKSLLSRAGLFAVGVWRMFDEKLAMESFRFSETELAAIEALVAERETKYSKDGPVPRGSLAWWVDRVSKRVKRVQYLRLRQELSEGQNPEINIDRQALISRLEGLGFRKEIVAALNEVDKKIYEAGKPLDFKGCMDLLRSIYEELIEDSAKNVATKSARSLPQGGAFQPWRQYLENEGLITFDEGEVAQKLYNYLSNAGAHQLGSAPEQVRVSKNMVIELSLMIVGRVQKFQSA